MAPPLQPPNPTTPRGRTLAQALSRLGPWFWVPLDAAGSIAAVLAAHALSPVFHEAPWHGLPVAVTYAVALLLSGHAVGLYDHGVLPSRGLFVRRGLAAAVGALGLTLAIFYVLLYRPIGRWVSAWTLGLATLWLLLPRFASWAVLRRRPRRVLLAGSSPFMDHLQRSLERDLPQLYAVAGTWDGGEDLPDICRRLDVDEIVLPLDPAELARLLPPAIECLSLGCHVRSEADFHEQAFRTVPVSQVSAGWLLGTGLDTTDHVYETVKRLADVLAAACGLALSAPFLLCAAAAIRLDDPRGPALFRQTRVGRHGRTFSMLKLRTMRVDAEQGQPQWAEDADPRLTRLGWLLRHTRTDELPQLVNILRGEMSFVGPRPERPEFVLTLEREIPFYAWRHVVRPGLTGWAQINHPYGSSVADAARKLEFDLYYVRHRSLVFDLVITLRTATAVLHGAR